MSNVWLDMIEDDLEYVREGLELYLIEYVPFDEYESMQDIESAIKKKVKDFTNRVDYSLDWAFWFMSWINKAADFENNVKKLGIEVEVDTSNKNTIQLTDIIVSIKD